eukprot:5596364-Amphidinium_carterae.1
MLSDIEEWQPSQSGALCELENHISATLRALKNDVRQELLQGSTWQGNATRRDMREFLTRLVDEEFAIARGAIPRYFLSETPISALDAKLRKVQDELIDELANMNEKELLALVSESEKNIDDLNKKIETLSGDEQQKGEYDRLRLDLDKAHENLRDAKTTIAQLKEMADLGESSAAAARTPVEGSVTEEGGFLYSFGALFAGGSEKVEEVQEETAKKADDVPASSGETKAPSTKSFESLVVRSNIWNQMTDVEKSNIAFGIVLLDVALTLRGPSKLMKATNCIRGGDHLELRLEDDIGYKQGYVSGCRTSNGSTWRLRESDQPCWHEKHDDWRCAGDHVEGLGGGEYVAFVPIPV